MTTRPILSAMISKKSLFTTKELSPETWSDFARLFSQGNGWDHCWCIHFQRPRSLPKEQHLHTRVERSVRNCQQKKSLVDAGRAHGMLVYAENEPVGWCQYGLREELPRIDNSRNYRALSLKQGKSPKPKSTHQKSTPEPHLWRITCFVVDKRYRRRGVATAALKAVLASIKQQGGGIVEAYPITRWESRAFGNESTNGTYSMFKRQGFKTVASLGSTRFSTHVLVRRFV